LKEDAPKGDVTTRATVPPSARCSATLVAKEKMVLCGLDIFCAVFKELDPGATMARKVAEGTEVKKGTIVAEIRGNARAVLTGERVALNLMQRMSGVATLTSRFVAKVRGTGAVILDTRKTTPLLRDLEKYAVVIGGGQNHRRDLSAMVLIKENHIAMAGGVANAVARSRKSKGGAFVEVEVQNQKELQEAIAAGVDRVLLDNMTPAQAKKCVERVAGRCQTESSGNMSLDRVRAYATAGVDFISVGALTHSYPAADLSLLIKLKK